MKHFHARLRQWGHDSAHENGQGFVVTKVEGFCKVCEEISIKY